MDWQLLINHAGLILKKHSPEILTGTGIVCVVGGTVLACRATLKTGDVLDELNDNLDDIHTKIEESEKPDETGAVLDYPVEDQRKDIVKTYVRSGLKLAGLYLPAVALEAGGIGCILASDSIQTKRIGSLGSALAATTVAFDKYRKRVKDAVGEEEERDIYYGVKKVEVEEEVTDEKGKTKKVKKEVKVVDDNNFGPYSRFFDESCYEWDKNPEYNLTFLTQMENQMNNQLRAKGHLYLNEVYDALGMERSKAGQVVGWLYDPNNENLQNHVSFDIFNGKREANRNFVNGFENVILLDFNVDGNILDMMP